LALLPALTFVATASAVEQCGYRVHLADISPDDWMLDARALHHHPLLDQIGLVLPVAAHGRPVIHEPWLDFRRQVHIPIVIDGAASFEGIAARRSRVVSDIPVALSFHATKAFATGEGGAVVTTDSALATSVTRSLNFGFHEDRRSRGASTNGKMSEYHAAVGLAELDAWLAKQKRLRGVADTYRKQMGDAGLSSRLFTAPDIASCYVLYRSEGVREATCVAEALAAGNIGFRSWYGGGVHSQPHYEGVSHDPLPVTDHIAPLLIGLPVAPDLSVADVTRVVAAVERGVRQAR
jgi:dTDP-4-amino-4,6-dideoxygalactose transaminase